MSHPVRRLVSVATIALTIALSMSWPAGARADLTLGEGFVFQGQISKGDPVNVLFHGGTMPGDFGVCVNDGRSPFCVASHLESDWRRGTMSRRLCSPAGRAQLGFYRTAGGTTSAADDQSLTTSATCKKQFHIRLWSDAAHGHAETRDGRQFVVGAIHHENRGALETGHDIDWHWETAENAAITQMGASQAQESKHCTYPDYRRLPGSGTAKGKKSNGEISRISFQHFGDQNGCSGS